MEQIIDKIGNISVGDTVANINDDNKFGIVESINSMGFLKLKGEDCYEYYTNYIHYLKGNINLKTLLDSNKYIRQTFSTIDDKIIIKVEDNHELIIYAKGFMPLDYETFVTKLINSEYKISSTKITG